MNKQEYKEKRIKALYIEKTSENKNNFEKVTGHVSPETGELIRQYVFQKNKTKKETITNLMNFILASFVAEEESENCKKFPEATYFIPKRIKEEYKKHEQIQFQISKEIHECIKRIIFHSPKKYSKIEIFTIAVNRFLEQEKKKESA